MTHPKMTHLEMLDRIRREKMKGDWVGLCGWSSQSHNNWNVYDYTAGGTSGDGMSLGCGDTPEQAIEDAYKKLFPTPPPIPKEIGGWTWSCELGTWISPSGVAAVWSRVPGEYLFTLGKDTENVEAPYLRNQDLDGFQLLKSANPELNPPTEESQNEASP